MQFNGAIVSTRVEGRKYPFFGYAPGDYLCMCHDCKKQFLGDKRCLTCEPCAEAAYLRADLMQQIELLERCHYGIA
ncbi:MAG TPA: hypothetical protein P5256_10340, partial [Beijerinckiaceae bacterium]|nr:hypothetical protein [Beijerinckiaceae bacterium]